MEYRLLIGGQSIAAASHAPVLNPSTGEVVGLMPLATTEQLLSLIHI